MATPRFEVVVAMDRERGIGRTGELPWRLPGDVAHFVALTLAAPRGGKNAVIMGRRTWDSIPQRFRPLKSRYNLVLSRQSDLALPPGAERVADFAAALERARAISAERIFVIGGAEVYAQALAHPACGDIHLTAIEGRFDCDTFFPNLPDGFVLAAAEPSRRDGDLSYRFERWIPSES
jgi:dihydrofolate reductase